MLASVTLSLHLTAYVAAEEFNKMINIEALFMMQINGNYRRVKVNGNCLWTGAAK